MFNKFIKITEIDTHEKLFINLEYIRYFREVKSGDNSHTFISLKFNHQYGKNFLRAEESIDYFEKEFTKDNK